MQQRYFSFSSALGGFKIKLSLIILAALAVCLIATKQPPSIAQQLALPKNPRFIIDADSLNDPDDMLAHLYAAKEFGKEIALVTTTLYDPATKAKGVKLLLTAVGYPDVPVSSGYGVAAGQEADFLKAYPNWPTKFGIPGTTNQVSLLQGRAYRHYFPEFDAMPISVGTAVSDLIATAQPGDKNVVIIAQAPLTNLALAFDQLQNIERIVLMGGWFEDEQGAIARLGYNTAVDLKAAQKILEQRQVPVVIVSSELVKRNNFVITEREREVLFTAGPKTRLGEALCADMQAYWEHRIPAKGPLVIADMLTAYIAKHPEAIAKAQCVNLKFNPELLGIDMFHPRSKEVIQVTEVAQSNIYVIKELVDPAKIRLQLVLTVFASLYPGVSEQSLKELLLSSDESQHLTQQLNQLVAATKPLA